MVLPIGLAFILSSFPRGFGVGILIGIASFSAVLLVARTSRPMPALPSELDLSLVTLQQRHNPSPHSRSSSISQPNRKGYERLDPDAWPYDTNRDRKWATDKREEASRGTQCKLMLDVVDNLLQIVELRFRASR